MLLPLKIVIFTLGLVITLFSRKNSSYVIFTMKITLLLRRIVIFTKKIVILTIFSNRLEGKNSRSCPHHPGKNGNSRPGGVPRGQEWKFPPGWSKILARVVIFREITCQKCPVFLRENASNLLLIRKNRILNQWLGQE